VNLGKIVLA